MPPAVILFDLFPVDGEQTRTAWPGTPVISRTSVTTPLGVRPASARRSMALAILAATGSRPRRDDGQGTELDGGVGVDARAIPTAPMLSHRSDKMHFSPQLKTGLQEGNGAGDLFLQSLQALLRQDLERQARTARLRPTALGGSLFGQAQPVQVTAQPAARFPACCGL
jgi:hypothetical protein